MAAVGLFYDTVGLIDYLPSGDDETHIFNVNSVMYIV